MELLYPGYKAYFDRFRTKPFHTEYTTRYCNSEEPVLYSQVPKYSWSEPRRPTITSRYMLERGTRLTYLRPPFAARMTSYVSEENGTFLGHKEASVEGEMLHRDNTSFESRSGSFVRKVSTSKLPEVHSTELTTRTIEADSPNENLAEDPPSKTLGNSPTQTVRNVSASVRKVQFKHSASYAGSSGFKLSRSNRVFESESLSLSRIANSARTKKLPEALQTPSSTRASSLRESIPSPLGNREEQGLRRVVPRPSSLLSKHPKNVRYVRDTCFFQPTLERKKHYYIVNPNWFSEQRTTVGKNNVFS